MSLFDPAIVSPRDASVMRISQISDCHIFDDPGGELHGLNTRQSLDSVLEIIAAEKPGADLLLATGDLAEDASPGAYRFLAERLGRLGRPVFGIPGNHDDPVAMESHLTGPNIDSAKLVLAADWIVLLVDSTLRGQVHGQVAERQYDFIDRALDHYRDRPALVAVHHQAVNCGSEWIDRKGMPDNAEFRRRLLAHDNLRAVTWGHVHQQGDVEIGGVRWMSAPSTCVQFARASPDFAIGEERPGYRQIRLHPDGSVDSEVLRLG